VRAAARAARELERLGFAPDLAQATLADVMGDTDERAAIARVVAARMHGLAKLEDPAAYRKMFGALLRRGFPADAIRDALRPFWGKGAAPTEAPDD
jgi:SOS response regulatory protein OraA/RecX